MSQQLISRSPDLRLLRHEGYDIEVTVEGFLVVRDVPYLNEQGDVRRATLICPLNLAGDVTSYNQDHVVHWTGDYPCRKGGGRITGIEHGAGENRLTGDLIAKFSFSNKPPGGYRDYHHKMTRYVEIISAPAASVDPAATARTFPVVRETAGESPFHYLDTAASRAEIVTANEKLRLDRVAIVGLGGSGSYVLDLVAKTPVREIHLFDDDVFFQHNAFRAPGAASIGDLQSRHAKVSYYARQYGNMRKGIVPHLARVNSENVGLLDQMDFVFICVDGGRHKQAIVERLEQQEKPFIDVGMGIMLENSALVGVLRVTTSTDERRAHVRDKKRISFGEAEGDDYARNIQVADLNALNAALAVVKWKKLCGFYHDFEHEYHSTYTIDTNMLLNDDIYE